MRSALIIANTEYTDPGLAQLTAPGKDAEDFARVLKDQDICAFDQVNTLLNEPEHIIRGTIDEFFDQKKPDDLLVLYFSGHGVRDEIGALYLAVKNTIRGRLRSTAIKSDYIREAMDQSRSKRQVLILDCCNSGAFTQGAKAELGGAMGMVSALQGRGRFILTASDATQFAWEGNTVIGETQNSLFTHFLVKGLEGEADSDGDGRITVDELYDYAHDQISNLTPKQTPTKSVSIQEGEIILRQLTRVEDIKPIALSDQLVSEIENPYPEVRLRAIGQLAKLVTGRNLGLARSARAALELLEKEDDSRRVSQAAMQVLESLRQEEKKAEEERKAKEEAERLAALRAEEERKAQDEAERLAEQKRRAEKKAEEEAERLAALKAEEERLVAEKAEAERRAKLRAERLAKQKRRAEEERKAKEEAERLATRKTEEEANQLLTEQRAKEKLERQAAEREDTHLKTAREEKTSKTYEQARRSPAPPPDLQNRLWLARTRNRIILGGAILIVFVCSALGLWGINYYRNLLPPTMTPTLDIAAENNVSPEPSSPSPEPTSKYTGPKSKDPNTFTKLTFGEPNTLDPALSYENAGNEIIQNVYEPLIFYDGVATDKFVPMLAESWDVSENGTVYIFHIRKGVKFHQGQDLTPEDVAYSFQRGLLLGGYNSPQWLLAEPFFGVSIDDVSLLVDKNAGLADDRDALSASNPEALKAACEKVTSAIVANESADTVTMTLAQPWAPFLATLVQSWGSILDKDWTISNGGWDGSCNTWQNYYAEPPETDPFTGIMNGTGPFKLDHWTRGEEIVLVRNDNYWREPAKLERILHKFVDEWDLRFTSLQSGDADWGFVPIDNLSQVDEMVGERCEFDLATNQFKACVVTDNDKPIRLSIGQPSLVSNDLFFTFDVAEESNYIGSGQLDGNGIPPDFFSDIHIRKGFAYSFNWETFIQDVFKGEGVQVRVLAPAGMPGYESDAPIYTFDLDKAAEEFKLADIDKDGIPAGDDPAGDVWTTGFRMQAIFNQGNTTREPISEILSANLNIVNELFIVESVGVPWPTYLKTLRSSQAPYFVTGWFEDIHDPHNRYVPYLVGTYAARQRMPDSLKEEFRALIDQGVTETDLASRRMIYEQINQMLYDQVPTLLLAVGTGHSFEQRWVQGTVRNPIFPGHYYYTIYKE